MKTIIQATILLAFSFLCAAQGERALYADETNLQIVGTNFQSEGYSVCGVATASSGMPYVIKYNSEGAVQFAKRINANSYHSFRSLVDADDDNYYLLSELIGPSYELIYSLRKLNHSGDVIWEKFLEKFPSGTTTGYNQEYAAPILKMDAEKNIYLMSSLYQSINIYKLNSAGSLLWTIGILTDTVSNKNPGFDLEIMSGGSIICTGKAQNDVLFYCLSAAGQVLWSKRLSDNGTSYSRVFRAIELPDGNVFSFGLRQEMDAFQTFGTGGFFTMITNTNGDILSYKKYLLSADTIDISSGFYDLVTHAPTEIYFHPDGSKTLVATGFNYDENYSTNATLWVIKLDENDENVETFKIEDVDYYAGNYIGSPIAMRGNKLIFPSVDSVTLEYSFTVCSLDNLPVCKLQSAAIFSKADVNFDSGNIDSYVRVTEGLGFTEGPNTDLEDATNISHQLGCQKTTSITETLSPNQDFILYPNPAADVLHLFGRNSFSGEGNIYDLNGKLMRSQWLSGEDISISVSGLASSIYFLELKHDAGKITRIKFVKE